MMQKILIPRDDLLSFYDVEKDHEDDVCGIVRNERGKTFGEIAEGIKSLIIKRGKFDLNSLDYFNGPRDYLPEAKVKLDLKRLWRMACFAVNGASEGHYIHVGVIYDGLMPDGGLMHNIVTAKTFMGEEHALELVKELTYVCEFGYYGLLYQRR